MGWGRQPLLQAGASSPVVRRLLPLRRRKLPPMSQGTGRPLGSQPLSQLLEIRPPPACLSSLCGKSTTLILKQPKESKESKGGRPGGSSGSTHSPRRREGLSSTRSPPPHCWGDRTVPVGSYRALGDVYASRGRGVPHLQANEIELLAHFVPRARTYLYRGGKG